jgi:hypothetical protein
MFGHQNDIISQDQKNDASVTIPEGALNVLTSAPIATAPAPGFMPQANDNIPQDDTSTIPPTAPALSPTSIDGFSAPNAKLSSPFAYMQSSTPSSLVTPDEGSSFNQNTPQKEDTMINTQSDSTDTPAPVQLDSIQEDSPLGAASDGDVDDTNAVNDYSNGSTINVPANNTHTMLSASSSDHLLAIKQDALNDLSPLVSQLSLDPEEKFHTIMMLIRASDNQTLVGDAYAAAREIPDEKLRAQALLDVVNEINYFTGNGSVTA